MRQEIQAILDRTDQVIIGKEKTKKLMLTALLAGGHVLLEDVPGTGKTKLAKSMAALLGVDFGRIQFTPDMLPADITGLKIYRRDTGEFVLNRGPVFTNILLADEINRATPRTQSGLLECMEERQVTIDGETESLEAPFFVIATQNPIESSGTFPLPEAQTDRFMMKLSMGLPTREEEVKILTAYMGEDPLASLTPVISKEELLKDMKEAAATYVHPVVAGYIADIAAATRKHRDIRMGVSPRATLALMQCCRVYAWIEGRDYVIPDDVKALAPSVLAHRLILSGNRGRLEEAQSIIESILEHVDAPVENFGR